MKPRRIWRRRVKGWRMPPNTVCVTRGTRWGNIFRPYTMAEVYPRRLGIVGIFQPIQIKVMSVEDCVAWYRIWMETSRRLVEDEGGDFFAPIRGKNLACWCSLDRPCHADILLELANR